METRDGKEPKKLDELFHDTLKDIYYAEKKILTALPKMAKAAQNEELAAALEKHEAETEEQVARLEQVFDRREGPRQEVRGHRGHPRRRQGDHEPRARQLSTLVSSRRLKQWSTTKYAATGPWRPGLKNWVSRVR
jgi:Domain of unknown function (DUF892)